MYIVSLRVLSSRLVVSYGGSSFCVGIVVVSTFAMGLVTSCLVVSLFLSCLVLSCLVLSCLVLSCLVLSCLVLSCQPSSQSASQPASLPNSQPANQLASQPASRATRQRWHPDASITGWRSRVRAVSLSAEAHVFRIESLTFCLSKGVAC
jgi:hypothetical protein